MTRGSAGPGETIFAQATGAGRGGIAIIRISGSGAGMLLDGLTLPRPEPRYATLRCLRAADGDILDRALVLWFPGPASYTGEDCVELHLHAGPAVIEAVSQALREAGGRPAEPGEFTRRAFEFGRIDLVEAEGIADLVDAETETQRRQAVAQSTGVLSQLYREWSTRLRALVASQEASIDFPTESLPPECVVDEGHDLDEGIAELEAILLGHLVDGTRGEFLRRGLRVAVIGAPNVGKSTLINALTRREGSIVSDRPGTTRDIIEARTVLGDVPVTLIDTAGLRESDDFVEQEGVRRARQAARDADLIISVTCGNDVPDQARPDGLWVCNKIDIARAPAGALGVSARSGDGIDVLRETLARSVRALTAGAPVPVLTRERHRSCLRACAAHLGEARRLETPELRGEELRLALDQLGRLTGHIGIEDVLADIFSTFCIGK